MKLNFTIEYRTQWGEELKVVGSIPELGDNKIENALALHTEDGIKWSGTIKIESSKPIELNYTYLLFNNGLLAKEEWKGMSRNLYLQKDETYIIKDSWHQAPKENFFYSSAFSEVWLKRGQRSAPINNCSPFIQFKAYAPQLKKNEALVILGNQEILGHWDEQRPLIMNDSYFPEWQQNIAIKEIDFPLEYKFAIINIKTKKVVAWENNSNRYLPQPNLGENNNLILSDRYIDFDTPIWKGAGLAVPVFSLRTEQSFGIGEFSDIIPLVKWAIKTKQQLIQLLPINDTSLSYTKADSYPYRCISAMALHPIYISLEKLGIKESKYKSEYLKEQKRLNKLKFVDYDAVIKQKLKYSKLLYLNEFNKLKETKAFKDFVEANTKWLKPYALYLFLKEFFNTSKTSEWGNFANYSNETFDLVLKKHPQAKTEIDFQLYLQYHLDKQLIEACRYANKNRVVLKGDLPIGVGRESVESWIYPDLFNLKSQAGAPPDDFAIHGQNWGFPTYNWEKMAEDNYSWWRARLQQMAKYFDAYRIDHILGFFRIWSIPYSALHGLLGQFYPADPFSKEELAQHGFYIDTELHTIPYISKSDLKDKFKERTKEIEKFFFINKEKELLEFKHPYTTQRALLECFESNLSPLLSKSEKEYLMDLHTEVLFLKDSNKPDLYHPRILAHKTKPYLLLDHGQQEAFNQLYNDFFYVRHNEFWQSEALTKLPALVAATDMLVCGEDLGMIPDSVPWVMEKLSILSLEVQRMPKRKGVLFEDQLNYPYSSVSTFSTHDMSTLRGWWEENAAIREKYCSTLLNYQIKNLPNELNTEIAELIIDKELSGSSMLTILALQDWLALSSNWTSLSPQEEQINIPAQANHYWRYRMPGYLSDLLKESELNNKIRDLIESNNREN